MSTQQTVCHINTNSVSLSTREFSFKQVHIFSDLFIALRHSDVW